MYTTDYLTQLGTGLFCKYMIDNYQAMTNTHTQLFLFFGEQFISFLLFCIPT